MSGLKMEGILSEVVLNCKDHCISKVSSEQTAAMHFICLVHSVLQWYNTSTVEPLLKDHPIGH